MRHYRSLEDVHLSSSWVTIGTFDGVHLGHQEIIRGLVQGAQKAGKTPVVITFHPHPAVVLGDIQRPFYLTMPEKRAQLLGELGVEVVITHPFNHSVSQLSPETFIARLDEHLHLETLWIGYDFALGKDREGDPQVLEALGETYGYQLHITPPVEVEGHKVSSSKIRSLLRQGQVVQAAGLLGRPFSVQGEVVLGDQRGRSLGFPTSNLQIPEQMIDIQPGVYAGFARVEGKTWKAVTNVGFRPTFEGESALLRMETHLLDFSGDLYQQTMELSFHTKLREERKFERVEHLIAQIDRDIQEARRLLTGKEPQHPGT